MTFQLYFLWTERFPSFPFTEQAEAEIKRLLPDGFNSMTILIMVIALFKVILCFNHLKPIYKRHESILPVEELAHSTSYVKHFQQAPLLQQSCVEIFTYKQRCLREHREQ